jgi:hypothetical protein
LTSESLLTCTQERSSHDTFFIMAITIFPRYTEVPRDEDDAETLLKQETSSLSPKYRSTERHYTRPVLALCILLIIIEGVLLGRATHKLNQVTRSSSETPYSPLSHPTNPHPPSHQMASFWKRLCPEPSTKTRSSHPRTRPKPP